MVSLGDSEVDVRLIGILLPEIVATGIAIVASIWGRTAYPLYLSIVGWLVTLVVCILLY